MAKTVKVSIIVDDNGSMRLTETSAKKLGAGLDKVAVSSRKADRALKGSAKTASAGGKNFGKQASIISGGLVPAYATLAAQVFAVSAAFNFLKEAGNLQLLQAGQTAYFSATGISTRQLTEDIIRATDAQLNFTEAAQAAAIGTAAGLNAEQITGLGKAAADVSQVLGRDLTDSFNRLVRGVTKAEPELLDELGIILRLEKATKDYALANNKAAKDLTAFERSQAVTAEVLGQVEEKYGRVLDITGRSVNQFAQLEKVFTDLTKEFKEFAAIASGPIVEVLKEYPILIGAAFAPFLSTILTAALPGLSTFGDKLVDVGNTATNLSSKAKDSAKELSKSIGDTTVLKQQKTNLQKELVQQANALKTQTKLRKNARLQQLRDGTALSKTQLARLKKDIETDVYLFSRGQKRKKAILLKTLAEMQIATKASTTKMQTDFSIFVEKTKVRLFSLGATGATVFAGMAAAAATLGKVLSFALGALSWVTLLASLAGVIYAFVRTKEETEEVEEKFGILAERVESTSEEFKKFAQVQNILFENANNLSQGIVALGNAFRNIPNTSLFAPFAKDQDGVLKKTAALENVVNNFVDTNVNRDKMLAKAREELTQVEEHYNDARKKGYVLSEAALKREQKYRDAVKNLEDSTYSLVDAMAASEDVDVAAFAKRLKEEANQIRNLDNAFLQSTPQVKKYLEEYEKLEKGTGSVEAVRQAREEVMELGSTIDSATRLTKANIDETTKLFDSFYPQSQSQRLLNNLNLEKEGLDKVKESAKDLDDAQKARVKTLNILIPKVQALITQEEKRKELLDGAELTYQQNLRGATNLQKAEAKLLRDIAKKEIEITAATDSRRNAVNQILEKGKAQLDTDELRNASQKEQLEFLLQTQDTARSIYDQETRTIELRKAELEILKRQNNEMQELADNAFNAFESNLQSGIASLIKGTETSFKDFALNITKGVLTNVADTLAKQMTSAIVNMIKPRGKTVDEKIKEVFDSTPLPKQIHDAIVSAGNHIAQLFGVKAQAAPTTGSGALAPSAEFTGNPLASTSVADPIAEMQKIADKSRNQAMLAAMQQPASTTETTSATSEASNIKPKLSEDSFLLPAGNIEQIRGKEGGLGSLFKGFTGKLKEIFNPEGGFLSKMGGIFKGALDGIGSLFKGLPDLLGGLFGGGGGGSIFGSIFGGLFGAAAGGIMPGGVTGYANGGIVKRPTLGLVGEGKMNEAVVPLPDGKAIPVNMNGGGNTNNVTVNVAMDNQGNAQTQAQSDGQEGANIGKLIAGVVQEELQRQKRPGGILSPYGAAS